MFDKPFTVRLREAIALALEREAVTLVPALTVGFTDPRYVRPLGTDVYGLRERGVS